MGLLKKSKAGARRAAIFHKSSIYQSPEFQSLVHRGKKIDVWKENRPCSPSSHLPRSSSSTHSPTDYDKQQQSLPFVPLPVRIIHEFPRGTWIDNLAIRSNGLILATLLSAPEIYQVDPKAGAASLATKIPTAAGLIGVAEIDKDVYYVVAGNYSVAKLTAKAGKFSV